jgi:hypothetical protein
VVGVEGADDEAAPVVVVVATFSTGMGVDADAVGGSGAASTITVGGLEGGAGASVTHAKKEGERTSAVRRRGKIERMPKR